MTIEERIAELESWLPALQAQEAAARAKRDASREEARRLRDEHAPIENELRVVVDAITALRDFTPAEYGN